MDHDEATEFPVNLVWHRKVEIVESHVEEENRVSSAVHEDVDDKDSIDFGTGASYPILE